MNNLKQLATGNQLLILQGITLIENGLQFIDHALELPNTHAEDARAVLQKRFTLFKDCVLLGDQDGFIVDRMEEHLQNMTYGNTNRSTVSQELQELRGAALAEYYREKELEQAEALRKLKEEI